MSALLLVAFGSFCALMGFGLGYQMARDVWRKKADAWFTAAMDEKAARFVASWQPVPRMRVRTYPSIAAEGPVAWVDVDALPTVREAE